MQIKTHNRHILVYLLLCSLFLTYYLSVLKTSGLISSDRFDIFSSGVRSEHSSMNGGTNVGHDDYLVATNSFTGSSVFSMRQSRWLSTKTSLSILTAIVATQMTWLIYYSRLSAQTYRQSNSSMIMAFLHKKDGMK